MLSNSSALTHGDLVDGKDRTLLPPIRCLGLVAPNFPLESPLGAGLTVSYMSTTYAKDKNILLNISAYTLQRPLPFNLFKILDMSSIEY